MNSFLKFYVMGRTEIDLFDIAHVKVEFIPVRILYNVLRDQLRGEVEGVSQMTILLHKPY